MLTSGYHFIYSYHMSFGYHMTCAYFWCLQITRWIWCTSPVHHLGSKWFFSFLSWTLSITCEVGNTVNTMCTRLFECTMWHQVIAWLSCYLVTSYDHITSGYHMSSSSYVIFCYRTTSHVTIAYHVTSGNRETILLVVVLHVDMLCWVCLHLDDYSRASCSIVRTHFIIIFISVCV